MLFSGGDVQDLVGLVRWYWSTSYSTHYPLIKEFEMSKRVMIKSEDMTLALTALSDRVRRCTVEARVLARLNEEPTLVAYYDREARRSQDAHKALTLAWQGGVEEKPPPTDRGVTQTQLGGN